jgi:hypothetical protein
METFKTELKPNLLSDFIDEGQLKYDIAVNLSYDLKANIIEQHKEAYGCKAYQIWGSNDSKSKDILQKIENSC